MSDEQVKVHFANKLRELREAAGLSQEELGEKIGCSRGSISFYEKSQRVPDIIILKKASEFFNVSPAYLLGMGVKSPDPDAEIAVQYTGLSEHNIDFLNTCALVERYCTLHPPVDASTPTPSFTEWADASGLRQKSHEELSHLPEMFGRFQREETQQTGAELQGVNDPAVYGVFLACLHLANDLVEMVKEDTQMVADFISISPTTRLGIAQTASRTATDSDGLDWNTIHSGMQQITYSDFIRFKASEVGRAIERHLLEKYGYGND